MSALTGPHPGHVQRPDGSTYRRRKTPEAIMVAWNDDGMCAIVLRTHDIAEALPLARDAWASEYGVHPREDEMFPADDPVLEWIRHVPWGALGLGYDSTWLSASGNDKGATPCVRFGGDR